MSASWGKGQVNLTCCSPGSISEKKEKEKEVKQEWETLETSENGVDHEECRVWGQEESEKPKETQNSRPLLALYLCVN